MSASGPSGPLVTFITRPNGLIGRINILVTRGWTTNVFIEYNIALEVSNIIVGLCESLAPHLPNRILDIFLLYCSKVKKWKK